MHILIATGGAHHSDQAVEQGALLYQLAGRQLTLLTVVRHEPDRASGEAILARATTLLSPPLKATGLVRVGRAAEEIIAEAASRRYDLLVIGEADHHRLSRRFLAPTALRVIDEMPCPVLVARGVPRLPRRVLVCEGGRVPSLLGRLLDGTTPLLRAVDDMTVLHVMSQMAAGPGVPGWELRAEADELIEKHTYEGTLLERDLERLAQLNVKLEAKVRHGLVVTEILAEAQSGDYDLVVIGAHRGTGWGRFLLDDLAREIVRHADRPLLVV